MCRARRRTLAIASTVLLVGAVTACASGGEYSRVVKASAYNSVPEQTNEQPWLAAWGDRLAPGMKAIAVSRDLLEKGLTRGVRVRIEGLPGEYLVLDKMAKRWRNKIDIYMGQDVEAARRWGVREVRIRWTAPHP
jgi:3D (Asp-Asp-Asp) domain-containing protein